MRKRSSLMELTKGRWREFRREPSAFFFVIFMPIVWMAILGSAFSGQSNIKAHVGWIEGQSTTDTFTGVNIVEALSGKEDVVLHTASEADIITKQKRGDIAIFLSNSSAGLSMVFDPASQDGANAAAIVNRTLQEAAGRKDLMAVEAKKIDLPGTRYIDFLIPGLIALSIMTSSLFGTGMLIVSNRRENLLKRYLATPMRPHEYIISHIFGRTFIFAVEISAILVAGFLMFGFKIQGSYLALIGFSFLGTASFTALAILCASRTANPAAMNGMTNVISLPMMMMAGVWFSRSHFPDWLASAVKFLPLTALVDGVRRIALEGAGIMSLGFECGILLAYAVISVVTAKLVFRWY